MIAPGTKTCAICGRTGTAGFWTQKRLYPEPNRFICNNFHACEKRRKAREADGG